MEHITTTTSIATPPKLCLSFPLPSQAAEPAGSVSPPPRASASVPFLWEEAPGKPWRRCSHEAEETTSKTLGLPPRLLAAAEVVRFTNMPSPTTVLDGPDNVGARSMSFTFSAREQRGIGGNGYFGSARWGSFRRAKAFSGAGLDVSPAVDEDRSDVASCGGGGSQSDDHDHYHHHDGLAKMARVRRRGSFLSLSHRSHNKSSSSSHNLLVSIYESFKQVVPWRRKQEKQRKIGS